MSVSVTEHPTGPAGYPQLEITVNGIRNVEAMVFYKLFILLLVETNRIGVCYYPQLEMATFRCFVTQNSDQ